ncbi:hypothetical protein QLQ12_13690 [Actinoplanes sp. NEAU-A12]|uniref:Uncharacterized protein n=1 Tax=Actinoplanes sandaracinus TaxID=3045177 RepID=A0ABT6WJ11_9ACTN|nr:hypothetical protein [Actinoplanes sandaracinus]MDI6099650.1 hypothetical protein [Actinoplanes sandaracinus]
MAVSGGAAWAVWSLTGTGSAEATAGSVATLTVTGASTTALVPGAVTDVTLSVTNPNKFPVKITSITFSGFGSDKAGCAGTNVEQTAALVPAGLIVPAATGSPSVTPVDFPASLKMIANAANECQGAKFTFSTDLGAESAAA